MTPQEMAARIGKTLPSTWGVAGGAYDDALEKIDYFNKQGITEAQLLQAGVPQNDINWMKTKGYTGTPVTATTTTIPAAQSTLSPNFSSYVYDMLAKGQIAANLPYKSFTGQRFAETPESLKAAFKGIAGLTAPTGEYQGTKFDTGLGSLKSVEDYMSPYTTAVTDITSREMRRQADIGRQAEQARLAQAGAYGGSRQAIMESERQRNLQQQMEDITTKGLQGAYDRAMQQRLAESKLGLESQQLGEQSSQFGAKYGLEQFGAGLQGLQAQMAAGEKERAIAQQPLDFGYQQFQESVKFPYQQATYMQSLLGGLPLQATPYSETSGQSGMFTGLQGALAGLALYNAMNPK